MVSDPQLLSTSQRPSIWFRAVGLTALAFVLTVLVMIAALFTDAGTPLNQWLNRYALFVLLLEVVLLAIFGFVAMLTDRPRGGAEQEAGRSDQP